MATKIARIQTADGRIARVEVPDDSGGFDLWESLKILESKSREGLGMLTEKVTPSREDIEAGKVGIPGLLARTAGETLSEVAPSFVSPLSILTAGAGGALKAAKKPIGAAGRFIGKTLESTSGLGYKTPGVLGEVVKRPSLLFGKGKAAAGAVYKSLKDDAAIRPEFKDVLLSNRSYVRRALGFIGKGEKITPDEALEARKAVDSLGDTIPDIVRKTTRNVFDLIAKKKYAKADKVFSDAVKSEAVRNFWSVNKSGSPSIVKIATGSLFPPALPFLSPLIQGTGAAAIGVGKKAISPLLSPLSRGMATGAGLDLFLNEE